MKDKNFCRYCGWLILGLAIFCVILYSFTMNFMLGMGVIKNANETQYNELAQDINNLIQEREKVLPYYSFWWIWIKPLCLTFAILIGMSMIIPKGD